MGIFDGIEDLLIILHGRSIQTGIVTSKTREELKDDFLPFGLMDYLPFAVCADDTQKHKPNPEPLLRFMEIAGADPCKSLYIGDTIYDWQCAKAAGVPFGLALWGAKQIDEIKAEHNFAYPGDIIQWLEK